MCKGCSVGNDLSLEKRHRCNWDSHLHKISDAKA